MAENFYRGLRTKTRNNREVYSYDKFTPPVLYNGIILSWVPSFPFPVTTEYEGTYELYVPSNAHAQSLLRCEGDYKLFYRYANGNLYVFELPAPQATFEYWGIEKYPGITDILYCNYNFNSAVSAATPGFYKSDFYHRGGYWPAEGSYIDNNGDPYTLTYTTNA